MKFPHIEIDQTKFYTIGVVCFAINALMGTISLVSFWGNLFWADQISRIASLFFSYALAGFFMWLRRSFAPVSPKDIASDEEMEEMLKNE